jgi:putative SOS response-associated peptidase YedK
MCNLYSLTKGQAAIRDLFRTRNDRSGNLPLFPGIFPDQMAPIIRRGEDGERELVMARWGMPGPPQFGGQPVTNIRNLGSPHWRRWLGQASRCIVPATSFCEYADTKPRKTPKWFALSDDRPLFAFAGLWTPWRGVRGLLGRDASRIKRGEHSFTDATQLETLLRGSQFNAVDVETVEQTIVFPSVVDYVRFQLLATPMTVLLKDWTEPQHEAIISSIAARTTALSTPAMLEGGMFTFPQQAYVGIARRPR